MIIDGNAIALDIHLSLSRARRNFNFTPTLGIVLWTHDAPSRAFAQRKIARAKELDISVQLIDVAEETTEAFVHAVKKLADDEEVDGIIVQLPLPLGVNRDDVLRAVPLNKDADVLSPDGRAMFAAENFPILPPLASAVQALFERYTITVSGREALVVGHGILVGSPLAQFLRHCGARVTVVDRPVNNLAEFTEGMELIVMGAGVPGLLKPEHVMDGAIVLDAGMKMMDGKLRGDADPEVAMKCAIFTPTPGGLGPIVVEMLLKNVMILAKRRRA